ncbi:MAG: PilN domain-containing protein [Spiribacter salinus]|uniref:PilN domain-containing protein n=1 Tax=Spiribacter salinus TaxID=1335746 RepID=A0A540VSI4_9GAMM|nr:MAG: PilN domain-containing protein [Spiribacter salinus]TQE99724.1 MAG: PilN domain-containing protein [Spiribacter salinus]
MATKTRLLAPVREFMRWWRSELEQLLPRRGGNSNDMVELEARCTNGQTLLCVDDIAVPVAETPPEQLRRRLATSDTVVLRLGDGLVLRSQVELPAAAEENLRQVLWFEMDRQTPFRPEAVYFDYLLIRRQPDRGSLRVDLAVAPRAAVDPLLAMLERMGLSVQRMPPLTEAGMDLLPAEQRRRPIDWRSWSRRGLAGLAVALLVAVVALPLYQDQQRLSRLEQAVAAARSEALEVQRLREEIQQRSAAVAFAGRRKEQGISALDVLAEVTRRLGDDSWLQEFELQAGEVRLRGEGPNAAQLIDELDGSPRFTNPSFRAPVTQGTTAGLERYYLSAEVVEP